MQRRPRPASPTGSCSSPRSRTSGSPTSTRPRRRCWFLRDPNHSAWSRWKAQSRGTPVIAAAVGGLRYSVKDGESGYLVEGHEPADYAERIIRPPWIRGGAAVGGGHRSRVGVLLGVHRAADRDVYLELAGSGEGREAGERWTA